MKPLPALRQNMKGIEIMNKFKIAFLSSLALLTCAPFAFQLTPLPVLADDTPISDSEKIEATETIVSSELEGDQIKTDALSDVEPIESEDKNEGEVEGVVDKALEWVENKIVPLLGGVSIATILSALISVASSVIKSKLDKKNENLINGQDEKISRLIGEVERLRALMEERKEEEAKALGRFADTLEETLAAMQEAGNYSKTITEQVSNQNEKIDSVERMKKSIDAICVLTSDLLAMSEQAVKNGIARQAVDIIKEIGMTKSAEALEYTKTEGETSNGENS